MYGKYIIIKHVWLDNVYVGLVAISSHKITFVSSNNNRPSNCCKGCECAATDAAQSPLHWPGSPSYLQLCTVLMTADSHIQHAKNACEFHGFQ